MSWRSSVVNVFVTEPTKQGILDAIKKRRVYGSTDNIIADVRCTVGEMDVNVIHAAARKEIREVEGVSCALLRLSAPTVLLIVLRNQFLRPFIPQSRNRSRFRIFLPDP